MIQRILRLILGLSVSLPALAQEKSLSYPELEVTPRASERLRMESEREARGYDFRTHLPIQLSAVATLWSGLASRDEYKSDATSKSRDNTENAAAISTGVGAVWLGVTAYLAIAYRPYQDGWSEVQGQPTSTPRQNLTRERLAEEYLHRPSSLAWKLQWLSVLSNLGAGINLVSNVNENAKLPAIVASGLALAPMFFKYRWQQVAWTHEHYKKKIYGPIAFATVLPEADTGRLLPGLGWAVTF
ncbi:MAG: hypothetical protein AB7F86_16285 [Bdellovibrionales bacterium]